MRRSTQPLAGFFQVPNGLLLFLALTFVLDETCVLSDILALDLQSGMWRLCFKDKVVVAVWAILVALVKLLNVLAESLFALFACKDHFEGGLEVVCFRLGVAFSAIEPFAACCRAVLVMGLRRDGGGSEGLAAGRADRDLGVEDVFAAAC
jgi:hypothetical protein